MSLDRLTLTSGTNLPYYHTHPLSGAVEPERAVIVIHGFVGNASDYFNTMVRVSSHAGASSTTIIIAPRFQTSKESPEPCDAVWPGHSSWEGGGQSSPSKEGSSISSYEAVDEILHILGDKRLFPNLTRVTIVGHSGGAQLVHRYAVGGRAPDEMHGVAFRFVTANPSSYLYLTAERPVNDTGSCSRYNNYKYGLDHRNEYMGVLTGQQLGERYASRRVTYLLGTDDVHQDHDIDASCSAKVQGANRLERGRNYYAAMKRLLPSAPHDQIDVPGVGHDYDAMFDSTEGRAAIFGE